LNITGFEESNKIRRQSLGEGFLRDGNKSWHIGGSQWKRKEHSLRNLVLVRR